MGTLRTVSLATGFLLVCAPAFARGHGGGGHGGGGGHSSGGGGHSSGSGGFHAGSSFHSGEGFHSSFSGNSHSSDEHFSSESMSHAVSSMYGAHTFHGPLVMHDMPRRPLDVRSGEANAPVAVTGRVRSTAPIPVSGRVRGPRAPTFALASARAAEWRGPPRASFRVPAFCGHYFAAYPAYRSISYWVTDWVMVDLLVDQEVVRGGAGGGDDGVNGDGADGSATPDDSAPIPDGVKEELREEIDRDMSIEPSAQTENATDDPRLTAAPTDAHRLGAALTDAHHVFVVTKDVSMTDGSRAACTLTRADILRSTGPVAKDAAFARMTVVAAKEGSCARGSIVTANVSDLLEFERDLRSRVARGASEANAPEPVGAPADTILVADPIGSSL